ncbi:MAG: 2-hydroxyacid dehydrogenase [Bacteroidetes bacterium]|nr:2-hydroxyacid dehydrogenase [Bacteroidota bacterium]MBS1642086.1 2-hydroxyacid dehydrogenase [Bacteroidota bacterium]MBS1671926.1 2-hydroxyacid dehydrogenase [Bacteroidota bacterium]
MKITFFSAQPYDKKFFNECNKTFGFDLQFLEVQLNEQTVNVIEQTNAVCVFVNDKVNATVIETLAAKNVSIIALRCAGFNNVDLEAAKKYGIKVCRVPAYSPEAVAEHALAMILTLNRKTHKAYNRVREQNFSLNGLLGFNIYKKTIGVIGTGNIGKAFCKIMLGLGCRVIAFDIIANKEIEALGVEYLPLIDVLQQADIISLHCPLNAQTKHIVNEQTIQLMKTGVMLINTSRGALIDTKTVIDALKNTKLGYLGIDVYEQEEKLFFKDLSENIIEDDLIQRLMSFPNVLVTAHQAFFTKEAIEQIAFTTLSNIKILCENKFPENKAALLT